jgi:DNA-binding MarR family transcriptional regulator
LCIGSPGAGGPDLSDDDARYPGQPWTKVMAGLRSEIGDGLRGYHYRLLAALDEWDPASQAALGRGTGIDRSDVTAALVDLEERGLVRRDVNQADRRRNVVSITAAGARHLEALDKIVDEVQERLLAPLSEGERRQFITLTRRIASGG